MIDRTSFSDFLRNIRHFFYEEKFIETFTPTLVEAPGVEVHLQYFKTQYEDLAGKKNNLFLRSSPELAMKTLLFQGSPDLFQISPCFRNRGELGVWHRPEFLMLEYYQNHVSFDDFTLQFVELVKFLDSKMLGIFQKITCVTFSVFELFSDVVGMDLIDRDPELGKKAAAKKIISVNKTDDFETAFFKIMLDVIEPFLKSHRFAILNDYPESQAILSKIKDGRAQRFECYLDGVEICNAFDELLDANLNRIQIKNASEVRVALGFEPLTVDEVFLKHMANFNSESKLCGNAVGLERLFSCLSNKKSLQSLLEVDL